MSTHFDDDIEELASLLMAHGHAKADEIKGCTDGEVEALATAIGRPLPAAYRAFLKRMGHGMGSFLRGTDILYRNVAELGEGAIEVLRDAGVTSPLPDDAFVFAMHQGYQFWYLRLDEGDDPPVYYFLDSKKTSDRVGDSFIATLRNWIETSRRR